jgi:hypothetical protein
MCREKVRKLEVATVEVERSRKIHRGVIYWSIKLKTTKSLNTTYHAP